jgi:hypothetical protein
LSGTVWILLFVQRYFTIHVHGAGIAGLTLVSVEDHGGWTKSGAFLSSWEGAVSLYQQAFFFAFVILPTWIV